ncbi:MAG: methylenetetrahydrofolate--tRNA-(uracil(54)-C(5))-methyltransferase (FADH(2)-oxidizing) TrmFO [Candidatus Izimaplasma sp.]|nr:methylenetetrahydrofolate--tRNA-(uracil(54)-C(5))-methyltransferase (FADH(2)-oxidizing) TrmFO [Candidatus Izimaplasma bacterium]
MKVNVIGAGLAGSEAAYQLAKRNIKVRLFESKNIKKTPAQSNTDFAELVCSNSLRSNSLMNAAGVMKEELRKLDSLVLRAADKYSIPAGNALAVDRKLFSEYITKELRDHPNIEIIDEEVKDILSGPTIIASGPLTHDSLAKSIKTFIGEDMLYFYDAIAPVIEADSINMDIAYYKSRYDKGEADYINCPMTEAEYSKWYEEVINAKMAEVKDFEMKVFEGCMPFEEMAKRGYKTLVFGPLKPVGLAKDDSKRPFAVVQLRQDNLKNTMYNLVGFQTHLTFSEQKRIIRMIPGLEKANIIRYGIMHRNTYINAPGSINEYYQSKTRKDLFFAGQLAGVEGYVESTASGLVAGINLARLLSDKSLIKFPLVSAIGSQANYIANANINSFQPMNTNFGLFPEIQFKHKKKERKMLYANRALDSIDFLIKDENIE